MSCLLFNSFNETVYAYTIIFIMCIKDASRMTEKDLQRVARLTIGTKRQHPCKQE